MATYEINGKDYTVEFLEEYMVEGFIVQCDIPSISFAFLVPEGVNVDEDEGDEIGYSAIQRINCGEYSIETSFSDMNKADWEDFMDNISPDGMFDMYEFVGRASSYIG